VRLFYIFLTIFFTVYGQLIMKWQVDNQLAKNVHYGKAAFIAHLLFNPWVISSFIAAFLAAMAWILAISKSQLSYAYPFMSLSFVIVMMFSYLLFNETLNWQKIIGTFVIMLGVVIVSRSTI
jgi:drug/metabolite transporter (DMT)-like permease